MRILVLNYEYPPLGGGAGNATYFLSREWGRMGITTDVITTWFSGLDEISAEHDNVTVYRVKSLRKKMEQSNPVEMLSYVVVAYRKAVHLISKGNYDLTIAFFSIPCGLIAYRLLKKYTVPYIVLLRGGDVPGFLPEELSVMHTITMPFTKTVWKNAQRIIANSYRLRDLANEAAVKLKCIVEAIPNGVDVSFFKPVSHDCKKPFVFLFVGRFVNQKNLLYLLSQFEIANMEKNACLVLTGDGPEKEKIIEKIESSPVLKDSVILKPWTCKKELSFIYQSAHCFVNPSIDEGMPNAVLEAMACGLPVIASNIGGNNELVIHGKNGYIFNLEDVNSLSDYMKRIIIENKQYKSMASYSRDIVEKQYSWTVSAKSIVKEQVNAV